MARRGRIQRLERDINDANRRFVSFSGHELDREYRITGLDDDVVFAFGDLWGIGYTALRDGKVEKYLHEFRQKSAPILAAGPGGDQLYIIGGNYKFGPRGIVDK